MLLLLPSAIVWLDGRPGLVEANAAVYDRMLFDSAQPPSGDILIVGIDKRTLETLGPWPVPRSVHALLLEQLAAHEPKAVLLDLFLGTSSSDPAQDQALTSAMAKLPVYLPLDYAAGPDGEPSFKSPALALAKAARGVGHANATPDADGFVRGIWRWEGSAQEIWPYLGLVMAGEPGRPVTASHIGEEPGSRSVRRGRFGIDFAGAAGSYPTVSYLDILYGNFSDELVRGKFVLIGALADAALGDTVPVAGIGAQTNLPGVEVHANALDALLHDRAIEVPTDWRRVLWISVPIWLALLLYLLNASHSLAWTFSVTGLCIGVNYLALVQGRIALPFASPLCGVAAAYVLWSWRRMSELLLFFRERAERLNAVPAGAFEPPLPLQPVALDSVERRTNTLDLAIERLTRLQALLTQGMWSLPVPVLICRPDGVVSQSNAAAQQLLAPQPSLSSTGLMLRRGASVDRLQGVNLPQLIARLRRAKIEVPRAAQSRSGTIWDNAMAHEYTTDQGSIFTLRAASLDESATQGESLRAWVVVLNDITAQRQAQREREQLFSFLSHDVRSPQVSILSLLALHADGAPGGDLKQVVEGIGREARRTIRLVENFMDTLEAESRAYNFMQTEPASVVIDAIDAIWATAHARGLSVAPRLGTVEGKIWADAPLLTRGVVNLLNNAIRHSQPGASLHVCMEANPDATSLHGEVVISVQDEGSGMDADRVRELMTREAKRKSKPGADIEAGHGWGIGLTIVRTVIARHGGWLEVMSAPGAGTTFLIGLPLSPDDTQFESDRGGREGGPRVAAQLSR
ncbi:CHASE2 domain-containing protein [Variovorax defluvii]|uniref:histidine kinase n=2 Tax=Variovorax defluvii TaxID=913761 RepID=A0ABP8I276_9BURK